MLHGIKKIPLSAFLPRILIHIDGIDNDIVSTYTMDAIIQFLRDTKLQSEISCIRFQECVMSYAIPTTGYMTEVLSVRFFVNGQQMPNHKFPYRIENNTLYLEGLPACLMTAHAEVELATVPRRDDTEVAEFIYEEWVDAITALTLSKLYLLTDNEWYNPQAANNQHSIYQQLVRQARFTKVTKNKPFQMRLASKRRL